MSDLLGFDRMITPTIIKIIFWIGLVLTVVGGLIILTRGGSAIIAGLFVLVLGPVVVRVYCEVLIVVFKIHATLVEIDKNTARVGVAKDGAE